MFIIQRKQYMRNINIISCRESYNLKQSAFVYMGLNDL